jgi:hypothetical protein
MTRTNFADDRLGDGYTKLQKTGIVGRSEKLNDLVGLSEQLVAATDKQVLYDVYYPKDPKFENIHYTEIFSNALLITHCDDVLRYEMVTTGVTDESVTPFDPTELLSMQLDKYRLTQSFVTSPIPAVIFLPASNLLEHHVDWHFVYQLYRSGAKIKPHPITSTDWLIRVKESFPGSVYDNNISGHNLLQRAETVYCTSASELGLLGKLMKKPVGLIDSNDGVVNRHIYRQLYEVIRIQPDPYVALCRLLASPYSGVYWLHDDPSKLNHILSILDSLHRQHYSPSTPANIGVSYEVQSEGSGFERPDSNGKLGMDHHQSSFTPIDYRQPEYGYDSDEGPHSNIGT